MGGASFFLNPFCNFEKARKMWLILDKCFTLIPDMDATKICGTGLNRGREGWTGSQRATNTSGHSTTPMDQ